MAFGPLTKRLTRARTLDSVRQGDLGPGQALFPRTSCLGRQFRNGFREDRRACSSHATTTHRAAPRRPGNRRHYRWPRRQTPTKPASRAISTSVLCALGLGKQIQHGPAGEDRFDTGRAIAVNDKLGPPNPWEHAFVGNDHILERGEGVLVEATLSLGCGRSTMVYCGKFNASSLVRTTKSAKSCTSRCHLENHRSARLYG